MHTINEDKWEKEVWGAAISPGTNSRDTANSNLILYWGKDVRHSDEFQRVATDSLVGQVSGEQHTGRINRSSGLSFVQGNRGSIERLETIYAD